MLYKVQRCLGINVDVFANADYKNQSKKIKVYLLIHIFCCMMRVQFCRTKSKEFLLSLAPFSIGYDVGSTSLSKFVTFQDSDSLK